MGVSFFEKKNWNAWPRVTYYATNTWKDYRLSYAHSHDRLELLYVYYGELTLKYREREQWKEVTLYSNDYLLIDVDILHTISTGACTSQVFSLEIKLVPDALSSLQYSLKHLIGCDPAVAALFSDERCVLRLTDSGHTSYVINEIERCLEASESNGNYFDLLVSALFASIGSDYMSARYPERSGIRHLRRATEYITSNLHRTLTCREIASDAGVSLNYLNRLFQEQYGRTMNEYINHLRIIEAKKLIERTDIPLSELYRQVGYQTPQNFGKQFVRLVGCTPSAYRKQLKGIHLEKNFEKNYNIVSGFPE